MWSWELVLAYGVSGMFVIFTVCCFFLLKRVGSLQFCFLFLNQDAFYDDIKLGPWFFFSVFGFSENPES